MFTSSSFSAAGGNRQAGLYRQVHVDSQVHGNATPHQLVVMLFDGFFEAISQGRGALREGQVEVKAKALTRAIRILDEGLRCSLDTKSGGTLAHDLNDLYSYVARRLAWANLKNDEQALDECVALMQPLSEAWTAIGPTVARQG